MTTAAVQDPAQVDQPQAPPQSEEMQLEKRSAAASIGFGMSARNWDEGLRIARQLANSALVPKNYQGHAEDIVVAMQLGAEIGLPPMQSLQSIAVINGKPGVYGDGFMAVIMSSAAYARHEEYYLVAGDRRDVVAPKDLDADDTTAVCSFWRRGNPHAFTATFSVADAKRAKLWGKEGPWSNYPARQMKWRARSWAGRDAFAAELRGMGSAEELQDIPEPAQVEELRQPIQEPVRRSEKDATVVASQPAAAQQPAAAEHPALTNELPPAGEKAPAAVKSAGRGTTRAAEKGPAEQKRSTTDGPSVTTASLVITDFHYCTPPAMDPYYEIGATVKQTGESPVAYVFVTRDEQLAKLAASCEGTEGKFNITWHGGKRPDGKACKVIEKIEAAN